VLRHRLRDRGVSAEVRSAGWLEGGYSCPPEVIRALAALGIEAPPHLSREVELADIQRADLILTMERRHVRDIVNEAPEAWPLTFTIKEFVRLTADAPRIAGETIPEWLARVGTERTSTSMMGSSPDDDVDDPYGRHQKDYNRTAKELDALCERVIGFAWPAGTDDE
jgi:protein-tyrosine phosphatase